MAQLLDALQRLELPGGRAGALVAGADELDGLVQPARRAALPHDPEAPLAERRADAVAGDRFVAGLQGARSGLLHQWGLPARRHRRLRPRGTAPIWRVAHAAARVQSRRAGDG